MEPGDSPIPAMLSRASNPHPLHMPLPSGIQAVRGANKYAYTIDVSETRLKESDVAIGAPRKPSPREYTMRTRFSDRIASKRTGRIPKYQFKKALMGAIARMILVGTVRSPWDWKYRL